MLLFGFVLVLSYIYLLSSHPMVAYLRAWKAGKKLFIQPLRLSNFLTWSLAILFPQESQSKCSLWNSTDDPLRPGCGRTVLYYNILQLAIWIRLCISLAIGPTNQRFWHLNNPYILLVLILWIEMMIFLSVIMKATTFDHFLTKLFSGKRWGLTHQPYLADKQSGCK